MIRVKKSDGSPLSLRSINPKSYNGEDVLQILNDDQKNKCYICEQTTVYNFEIDHFKPKSKYPELEFEWTNLLLICNYCNKRKSSGFDEILNPIYENIENLIEQRLDFVNGKAQFDSLNISLEIEQTISLLDKIFNGRGSLRKQKEKLLFDDLKNDINILLSLLNHYKNNRSDEIRQAIIDSLKIEKKYLAFKFWIFKDNLSLYNEFSNYLSWNK